VIYAEFDIAGAAQQHLVFDVILSPRDEDMRVSLRSDQAVIT
jgi:hypothetical protein